MKIDVLFASVPVADLARATAWYARLFGRTADIVPNDTEEMWHVADGAWVYVIVDAARAGHTLVSVSVPDLDDATASLEARGIAVESAETVGTAGRKAWLSDPDGNSLVLIEVHQPHDT